MSTNHPSGLLEEALTADPDYQQLRDRVTALNNLEAPDDIRRLQAPEQLAEQLVEQAIAGDIDPDQLEDAVARAITRQNAKIQIAGAVSRLKHAATAERKAWASSSTSTNRQLAWLNQQLRQLLADAAEVFAALAAVPDVEAAAEQGLLDQWRTARDLEQQYEQIRRSQALLWRRHPSTGSAPWASEYAVMEHPEHVDQHQLARLTGTTVRFPHKDGNGYAERVPDAPWPDGLHRGPGLAWIAGHPEAGWWVPTFSQHDSALTALADRRREFWEDQNGARPRRPVAVRNRDRAR